jgi:hypothetical protein
MATAIVLRDINKKAALAAVFILTDAAQTKGRRKSAKESFCLVPDHPAITEHKRYLVNAKGGSDGSRDRDECKCSVGNPPENEHRVIF